MNQAFEISEMLKDALRGRLIILPWMKQYLSPTFISGVLDGVRKVLQSDATFVSEELYTYFDQHLVAHLGDPYAPSLKHLHYTLVKEIAASYHAASKQSTRNTTLHMFGRPVGPKEYPTLHDENSKTISIHHDRHRHSAHEDRHAQYMDFIQSQKRKPAPRHSHANDLDHPGYFH